MLAPFSMTDAEYQLGRNGIPYVGCLVDDMDYNEFNETCFMPFLIAEVCILSLYSLLSSFLVFLHMVTLKYDAYVRCLGDDLDYNEFNETHFMPFLIAEPTVEEHEELVWLAGNLKLELTEYSRQIYGLGWFSYPGEDDDNGDNPKTTPSY
ncbi:hypothetical protein SO802_017552 [Lithocarpus litseifolius]|uniref:Uncharacterized protein n=1 Tax=Lithocarpus litseifolius TaxID=425828 RepID=A0AAW2CL63_9ROSI